MGKLAIFGIAFVVFVVVVFAIILIAGARAEKENMEDPNKRPNVYE